MSSDRFTKQQEDLATALAKGTIGLVTLDDFKRKKDELTNKRAAQLAASRPKSAELLESKRKVDRISTSRLSFAHDEDEDGEDDGGVSASGSGALNSADGDDSSASKRIRLGKDPSVDTSFLPDREREAIEQAERERLAAEWKTLQERVRQEPVQITFSYYDGSGHRGQVTCKKGDTIAAFLEKVRHEFSELRGVSVENLFYIKEDLIIPHHFTFYDFILNRARGKTGPLFHFDVHDDVRLMHDARVERDESHAGKVVERRWYERNKHIFPASRWEVYDSEKDYGSYRYSDRKK